VVGPGEAASEPTLRAAQTIGALVARAGAILVTGGGGGVMQAAAVGCASAGGLSVGILPGRDRSRAHPHSTLTIPTGLGELRNGLVVRAADAVICVALSWGTLSEVALAMRTGVPVIMVGPWEGPLAGPAEAATPEEAVAMALGAAGRADESLRAASAEPASPGAPPAGVVHHVTLSVIDVDRSAQWYQDLLGPASVVPREGPGWSRIRMQWPSGLVIGVTRHMATAPDDRFDHVRVGLDHVGLQCASREEVQKWAGRLDALGAPRGPVEDVPYAWAVTGRDPDNIPVEFFAPK
jgi:hypothetical protein